MAGVFENYERKYCELSANFTKKCRAATLVDGDVYSKRNKRKASEVSASKPPNIFCSCNLTVGDLLKELEMGRYEKVIEILNDHIKHKKDSLEPFYKVIPEFTCTGAFKMYNKVEAVTEKEDAGLLIEDAGLLIASTEYVASRENLLKAKQLFPQLDHISAMLTVCDILLASRIRVPGYETDFYWVLSIMPSASSIDLKQQYDKLLNLLQPIKGKFSGTALALKLVNEAFSVLSETEKRSKFESKRASSWDELESIANSLTSPDNAQCTFLHSSAQVWNVQNAEALLVCVHTAEGISMLGHEKRDDALGPKLEAICDCNKQYVVDKHSSVVFSDMISEGNTGEDIDLSLDNVNSSNGPPRTSNISRSKKHAVYEKPNQDFFNFEDNRPVEFLKIGQIWAVHYHCEDNQNYLYLQINAISNSEVRVSWLKPVPVTICERRWCDAALPVACGSFCLDLDLSEQILISPQTLSYNCSWVPGVTEELFEIYPKMGEVWALYDDWDLDDWSYNPEKVRGCKFEFVEMLSEFSKITGGEGACLLRVDGFKNIFKRKSEDGNPLIFHISPRNLYMLSHNVPAYKFTGGEIDGVVSGMIELDQLALSHNDMQIIDSQLTPMAENIGNYDFKNPTEPLPPVIPNSKCITLGPKLSINDFSTGQVWAVNYGEDLMPRRYARLDHVISESEMNVTFLKSQLDFNYDFHGKEVMVPVVCGIFQAIETNVNLNISQLSHQVKCQMSSTAPIYKIYPMKGEVWAMYQNWSCKWGPGDYENYKCWIVEILSDLSVDERIVVVKLGEVKGHHTFFQRSKHDGFDMSRVVLKTEIFCFSHQIPAFRVPGSGSGRSSIADNMWHLEPDALPPPFQRNRFDFLWGTYQRHHGKLKGAVEETMLVDMDIDSEDMDMEVDMIGGETVGTVDVVVPKQSIGSDTTLPSHMRSRDKRQRRPPVKFKDYLINIDKVGC